MSFGARDFRNALGMFPTGVTVVTGIAPDGRAVGITANSFSSVSLDPPLISLCLAKSLKSFPDLLRMQTFAVNLLTEAQGRISTGFAKADSDKWSCTDCRPGKTGNPIIVPNLATFECERYAMHEAGDHVLLVGRVLHLAVAEDERPLVFYRGRYRGVGQLIEEHEPVGTAAGTARAG